MSKKPSMTRKEALAALFELRESWVEYVPYDDFVSAEGQAFRKRTLEALRQLVRVVHGTPTLEEHAFLCERCHLRYAVDLVDVRQDEPGQSRLLFCCTPCRDQLKAAGQLVEEPAEDQQEMDEGRDVPALEPPAQEAGVARCS